MSADTRAAWRSMKDMTSDPGRALKLCWWFIENVTPEDEASSDIFFELREIVRNDPALRFRAPRRNKRRVAA